MGGGGGGGAFTRYITLCMQSENQIDILCLQGN